MGTLDPQVLDILGYVGIGFGVFYALIILFSVFKGYRRGVVRQSIRTGTILLSIIAAIVFIKVFVSKFDAACAGNTLEVAINNLLEPFGMGAADLDLGEEMAVVLEMDAMIVRDLILAIAAPILFPIVFTILFIVISFALYILYAITMLFIRKLRKKNNTKKTRRFGALVGLVQGVIVAAIFFLPFTNTFDTANGALEKLQAVENEELAETVEMIEAIEAPIYNFPMKMSNVLGGKLFANIVSTIDIAGESYNTREFLPTVADITGDIMNLTEVDFMKPTADDKLAIEALEDKLFDNVFFSNLVSSVFNMVGNLVEDSSEEMDIPPEFSKLFDAFLSVFKKSTKDSVRQDIDTFITVWFDIAEFGVLDAVGGETEEALFNALTEKDDDGKTLLKRITATLKANPNTAHIVDVLAELSVAIMAEQTGFSEDVTEIYTHVQENFTDHLGDLNDAQSASDVAPVLKDILDTTLADAEIEINIDDETYDKMAEYVYEQFVLPEGDISEDDLSDILFTYFDAMLHELEENQ